MLTALLKAVAIVAAALILAWIGMKFADWLDRLTGWGNG